MNNLKTTAAESEYSDNWMRKSKIKILVMLQTNKKNELNLPALVYFTGRPLASVQQSPCGCTFR